MNDVYGKDTIAMNALCRFGLLDSALGFLTWQISFVDEKITFIANYGGVSITL